MDWWSSLLLGAVQGLTEPLPVSSSAHLLLLHNWLGGVGESLTFDTALHLGTALSIFVFFYRDWRSLAREIFLPNPAVFKKIGRILAAVIPVGVIGVFWGDALEGFFRSSFWAAPALLFGSIVMLFSQYFSRVKFNLRDWPMSKAFSVGLAQVLALIPGVSRSGITVSAGLLAGLGKEDSFLFSFMNGGILTLLAGSWSLVKTTRIVGTVSLLEMLPGMAAAFVFGLLGLFLFKRFFWKFGWVPFIIYRILLAVVVFGSIIR